MIRRLVSLLGAMTRLERWVLGVLLLAFILSLGMLLRRFHRDSTILVPTTGGTYIEGSVGDLQTLNPWFTVTNDVNRDIVSLVYAGLLTYNPQSKKIEEDLATMEVSKDGKGYTLKLKENLFWHDSTTESPHPVTADDVLFTFKTIQNPEFPNTLLRENYRGITIEKVDARTVRFMLEEPYSFFPSNLTIGIVPQKSYENIPIANLALDQNFEPVGAGPYRVKTVTQTELSTEVTLERFGRELTPAYRLDRVVFRIFPDYTSLLGDLRNLDGVRLVPSGDEGEPLIPSRYQARTYTLPQYVALFYNLDKKSLQDQKLRLGLQLGTNKQEIVDTIKNGVIVDTPLLELDTSDWHYQFDAEAAQGALFESNWNLPEKIRLQRLLEQKEANDTGILQIDPVVLLDTGAVLTFTGSYANVEVGSKVNGIPVRPYAGSGTWIIGLPTSRGSSGALRLGENLIRLTSPGGRTIDSFYLYRATTSAQYTRAEEEQRVLRLFVRSRLGQVPPADRMGVQNLFLDEGMLRQRRPDDPVSTRRNDRGEELMLTLLTSPAPPEYKRVAEILKEQWAALGVEVRIDIPVSRDEFRERLNLRQYDLLLFGESLLDNLDSFPYWHSSGRQILTGERKDLRLDAYNLSQYASFKADALLETVRSTADEAERSRALQELRTVLKQDVPAIFLYSPLYTFAHRNNFLGVELGNLSLHSDRFLTLHRWYVKQERIFKPGRSWFSFFSWTMGLL